MSIQHDVVIIGGGAIGCATAVFLRKAGVERVCVIEPDPTYAKAATPMATGGCRRLFALPENIRMSQFSIEYYKNFAQHVAVDGYAPDVQWKERGYLFIGGPQHAEVLEQNARVQEAEGVKIELLDRAAIAARYPWMRNDDLALGVLSPEDGWLDPNSVLQGFRHKAQAMGVTFLRDRAVDLYVRGRRIVEIELASGARVRGDRVCASTPPRRASSSSPRRPIPANSGFRARPNRGMVRPPRAAGPRQRQSNAGFLDQSPRVAPRAPPDRHPAGGHRRRDAHAAEGGHGAHRGVSAQARAELAAPRLHLRLPVHGPVQPERREDGAG
jgi:hypothetical protein